MRMKPWKIVGGAHAIVDASVNECHPHKGKCRILILLKRNATTSCLFYHVEKAAC